MNTETRPASLIRQLAAGHGSDLVAAALFERTVTIWDVAAKGRISELETILDFGGSRLALSQAEASCLTAAYHKHGLACYAVPGGQLRWQRRDLKKIQQLVVGPDGRHAYCCGDTGPCEVVAIATGNTVDRIRGLRNVWMDGLCRFRLDESSSLAVVDWNGTRCFSITKESFALLDAAFNQTYVAVSEGGAHVRVFGLSSGREVVRHRQPEGHHVLALSATAGGNSFVGVQWNYQSCRQQRLMRFSADSSESDVVCELRPGAEVVFCHDGRDLVTSDGEIIDCETGATVGKLAFPCASEP